MNGLIDLHVHCSPDTRPRKMTAFELARAAARAGMRALLLKNHDTPTAALAAAVRETAPGVEVFGGIALNDAVGGFNPAAVETALKLGARQIWMPTHCAANERRYRGRPGGLSIAGEAGRPRPEVEEILRLAAEADVMVGTAHLSPGESKLLVAAAREAGVRKIMITHPEIVFVDMSIEAQRDLAGPDVYFERCYVRSLFTVDWDGLARNIRALGVESTVLATDLGQPENADPVSGLGEMCKRMLERGFSEPEVERMASRTPAWLLGL